MQTFDLSIIILSFNTADLTSKCIVKANESLKNSRVSYEIIIIDNASTDNSIEKISALKSEIKNLKLIQNQSNIGFGSANNIGIKESKSEFVLFLNSDALIEHIDWNDVLNYLREHQKVGVLTVKVQLPSGKLDMASHRGFPTLWRSFTYFTKLEKLFSLIPFLNGIFGGYHLLNKNFKTIHEIDSPTGAFFLTRMDILQKIHGFDEDYFMYGEDIDMSYRIKKLGFKVIYFPEYYVLHLKNQSGIKKGNKKVENATKAYFYEGMKIFYDKHYSMKHSSLTNSLVTFLINQKYKSS